MARTFYAFEIPKRVQDRLAEEASRLKRCDADVSWVKPEKYHVTLRFLGEIADEDILPLAKLLQSAAASEPPLSLVARGIGWFPEGREPRVIWAGVSGETESEELRLQRIRRALNDGARKLGLRPEKGAFTGHVTLGRVRSSKNTDVLLDRIGPARRREFAHFKVEDLVLFESHETALGTAYTPLETLRLEGRP